MSEYISKEDALKALCSLCGWDFFACDLCAEYCAIGEVTPADVKPVVRGEWVDRADERDLRRKWHDYRCSKCSYAADDFISGTEDWWCEYEPNFCPNCGADMRGEEK